MLPQKLSYFQMPCLHCHLKRRLSLVIPRLQISSALDKGLRELDKAQTCRVVQRRPSCARPTPPAALDRQVRASRQQHFRRFETPPEQCRVDRCDLHGVFRNRVYITSASDQKLEGLRTPTDATVGR